MDGEAEDDDDSKARNISSECFFAGKGTALVLALKDIPQNTERRLSTDSVRSTNSTQSNNSDIQQHLQSMLYLLRHEETLKMAVKLESQRPNRTRYLVILSHCGFPTSTTERKNRNSRINTSKATTLNTSAPPVTNTGKQARQTSTDISYINRMNSQNDTTEYVTLSTDVGSNDSSERRFSSTARAKLDMEKNALNNNGKCDNSIEESCLLGIDCNERTTIGLVVPILADTTIHLDGDGGFSVAVYGKTHIFKPVSVQAMWSALQTLHKVSQKAREHNFYPGGPSHDWLSHYESRIESDQSCLNEWNAMDSLESRRPPSPDAIRNKPTEKEETECVIKMKLKEIMMSVDLDEVTSKYIRGRLEEHLDMDLGEYKSFIDEEMLIILGQMDAPTEIFDHVYLGSEWNASNLEELQRNGVRHILNVTREIDNFFPGMFDYFNVRVYDDEKTNLLKHWDNTFRYINRAKDEGSKVLVHCKMGVSRSASVVIAYAMKAYNWEFQHALQHVKGRRNCIKPNKNFLNQLETYRGMLDAMKNKEKLQRSKSETNLKATKDARLLPGSEPTPLIQALNQSKSKSAGHSVRDSSRIIENSGVVSVSSISSAGDIKQRKVMRRLSGTSTKSIQSHTAIVMKQQSQSLENLTPERGIADEPKNVRFPGSNGENYSVTQNQVLHIQKNTSAPTSVKTIVNDLESNHDRKSTDDRKTLNLQFNRSTSVDTSNSKMEKSIEISQLASIDNPKLNSPVWTSSAKLITQTSIIPAVQLLDADDVTSSCQNTLRPRREAINSSSGDIFPSRMENVFEKEGARHTRKTQSWAPSSGGIIMDHVLPPSLQQQQQSKFIVGSRQSSSSSVDSAVTVSHCDVIINARTRQRELPSRHASWGSGDNRSSLPTRNSSWGSYDTNRNTFQYGCTAPTAAAIVESHIHELDMSNKTATSSAIDSNIAEQSKQQQIGTVKRTKQKLEESTVLKKLCQENGSGSETATSAAGTANQKRNSNLYRSQSAAAATRARFPNRCNSEEIMISGGGGSGGGGVGCLTSTRCQMQHSDGSKTLHAELLSASAPESYTMSDIENKNTLQQSEDDDTVVLRRTSLAEDQRISGNVKILKKNFEARASNTASVVAAAVSSKKGHQSLPSSPVAQHVDHHIVNVTSTVATTTASTCFNTQSSVTIAPTSCCANSPTTLHESAADRNVKGLVNRYQASSICIPTSSSVSYTTTTTVATSGPSRPPRPRSYYDNRHSAISEVTQHRTMGKPPHGYNACGGKPPLSVKSCNAAASAVAVSSTTTTTTTIHSQSITENILAHQQQRRVQQHGKTHPLARLSLPKQGFNAAAYNTM